MKSVKVLHCADIHIGAAESFLGENASKRRFETLLTFEKIIRTAKEKNVDFLLIAGDLFHSNNIEAEFVDRVFSSFNQIPDIKIIYVAGNHDPLNSSSPFILRAKPSNLYVLGGEDECLDFSEIGARIYGRSFTDNSLQGKSRFSIFPPNDDIVNIMVMHGDLKSDLNSSYNAITPDFVKLSGMDYIALGHVHKRTEILKLDSVRFAYSGCPEGQGFDELDDKGIYIGEISKNNCQLEFKTVSKRRHISLNIDISDCTNNLEISEKILKNIIAEYGENYTANLYKIALTGEINEDVLISLAEIESRLSDEVYFIKVKDKTTFKIDFEALSSEVSLKGIFVRNMITRIKEAENEEEKNRLRDALNIGLKAFHSEVTYDED